MYYINTHFLLSLNRFQAAELMYLLEQHIVNAEIPIVVLEHMTTNVLPAFVNVPHRYYASSLSNYEHSSSYTQTPLYI